MLWVIFYEQNAYGMKEGNEQELCKNEDIKNELIHLKLDKVNYLKFFDSYSNNKYKKDDPKIVRIFIKRNNGGDLLRDENLKEKENVDSINILFDIVLNSLQSDLAKKIEKIRIHHKIDDSNGKGHLDLNYRGPLSNTMPLYIHIKGNNNFDIGRDDKMLYIDNDDVNNKMYELIEEFLNRVKSQCGSEETGVLEQGGGRRNLNRARPPPPPPPPPPQPENCKVTHNECKQTGKVKVTRNMKPYKGNIMIDGPENCNMDQSLRGIKTWVGENPFNSDRQMNRPYYYYCPRVNYYSMPDKINEAKCESKSIKINGMDHSCSNGERVTEDHEYTPDFEEELCNNFNVRGLSCSPNIDKPPLLADTVVDSKVCKTPPSCDDLQECVNYPGDEKTNTKKYNDTNYWEKQDYWINSNLRATLKNELKKYDNLSKTEEDYIKYGIFPPELCITVTETVYPSYKKETHSKCSGYVTNKKYNDIYGFISPRITENLTFKGGKKIENIKDFFNGGSTITYIDTTGNKHVEVKTETSEECEVCDDVMEIATIMPYLMCVCSAEGEEYLIEKHREMGIPESKIEETVKRAKKYCRCAGLKDSEIKDPNEPESKCDYWLDPAVDKYEGVPVDGPALNRKRG